MARPRDASGRPGYFLISWVARAYRVHPQTLRLYERAGLLTPSRSGGRTRLYAAGDLERLEVILGLTREMGVNLAGVEVILRLRERVAELQREVSRLRRVRSVRRGDDGP
jgi:MerR family transcriptional regulator/heat shock protein HspR